MIDNKLKDDIKEIVEKEYDIEFYFMGLNSSDGFIETLKSNLLSVTEYNDRYVFVHIEDTLSKFSITSKDVSFTLDEDEDIDNDKDIEEIKSFISNKKPFGIDTYICCALYDTLTKQFVRSTNYGYANPRFKTDTFSIL